MKTKFIAVRWVDVHYFFTAYPPSFYRPMVKEEKELDSKRTDNAFMEK